MSDILIAMATTLRDEVPGVTPDVTFGLHFTSQIHRTALFPFSYSPYIKARVRYNLVLLSCMIQSDAVFPYDMI